MRSAHFLLLLGLSSTLLLQGQTPGEEAWLKPVSFDVNCFGQPDRQFGPFTRWWWPGNDVTQEELKRELQVFADHHFGGVEIQPTSMVMPCKGEGRADRIMSYDTPSYYDNLHAVMEEASKLGLTVDMTDGSGWPSGGAHLTEADNNLTLEFGMKEVTAPRMVIPRAERGDRPTAQLVAVLAAKVRDASGPTLILDAESIQDLTQTVQDSTVTFSTTEPGWRIIALWSMADMEKPSIIAARDPGFAMNHFDSLKVFKNYEHYFGERTGLSTYMGKTLRCAFNDSYEFRADRHWAKDFLDVFRSNRGYDPVRLLPANLWYGYNNMYYRMEHPNEQPSFGFGSEDWRLRRDYDLTVGDLLKLHMLDGSRHWMESQGMLHRTQAYGLSMDMMSMAGHASIPEMETMLFGRASEAGYKVISSGAHLYNRPIVTCETAVYIDRAFLTTPQKLRMTIDKILSCGVNQLIWHGTPYSYFPEGYPKEGWYPFWNSALGVNFSSMLSETNPFWPALRQVNLYAQRAQYVLRCGKAQADVLIYYPFLKFSTATSNPSELLTMGVLPDVEPIKAGYGNKPGDEEIETLWMERIYPLLDSLYAHGITWDWVNDESLASTNDALVKEDQASGRKYIDIRGNLYQGLILFDLPYMALETALHLQTLARQGVNILTIGRLPKQQPSFKDWQKKDSLTAETMQQVGTMASVKHVAHASEAASWLSSLSLPLHTVTGSSAMRQIRRQMSDGSIAQFYWNESHQSQLIRVAVSDAFAHAYWLNAEDGSIQEADLDASHCVNRSFDPLTTAFLYCTTQSIADTALSPSVQTSGEQVIATFDHADISIDTLTLSNHAIQDWRNDETLRYEGRPATYTMRLQLTSRQLKAARKQHLRYVLDLGQVCYTAQVKVNDQSAGNLIWTPYRIDITDWLKRGENDITVTVIPSRYNSYVNLGKHKDRLFKRLKDSPLAAEGLVGPVKIIVSTENK